MEHTHEHGLGHLIEKLRERHGMRDGGRHGAGHGRGRGHHGEGYHGNGGESGREGRRRMFESGELRLVMLLLMEAEPRHGYDLIREIETRTGGAYAPSPGIVYPALTYLEEIGQIEAAASEGTKRLFAITQPGLAYLGENRREAEASLARLEALGARTGQTEAGPVWRAMQNLKLVLEQRLGAAPDRQKLFDAADLIDEAARKIERLQ